MISFAIEIEDLTDKSVTVLITKSAPELKMGGQMMRQMVASALCDRLPGLEFREAHRMTQQQTVFSQISREYEPWGWKAEKVSETERRVTILFPQEDNQLFRKQPDGSYAASFADLFNRK